MPSRTTLMLTVNQNEKKRNGKATYIRLKRLLIKSKTVNVHFTKLNGKDIQVTITHGNPSQILKILEALFPSLILNKNYTNLKQIILFKKKLVRVPMLPLQICLAQIWVINSLLKRIKKNSLTFKNHINRGKKLTRYLENGSKALKNVKKVQTQIAKCVAIYQSTYLNRLRSNRYQKLVISSMETWLIEFWERKSAVRMELS